MRTYHCYVFISIFPLVFRVTLRKMLENATCFSARLNFLLGIIQSIQKKTRNYVFILLDVFVGFPDSS
jgi:hypothetical protein